MKTRVVSAFVGILCLLVLFYFVFRFSCIMDIVIAIAQAICVYEALNAGKLARKLALSLPCIGFALSLPFFIVGSYIKELIVVFVLLAVLSMIFYHKDIGYNDMVFAVATTLIISFGLSSIVMLYNGDRTYTVFYVVIALAMPWLSDSGAYFTGVFLGKHKLCPDISPKKTVEGAIGGVISGALFMLVAGLIFDNLIFPALDWHKEINYLNIFIYGLVCSFISIVGDLSFSLLKRSCGVKDYGNVIPGHGGILDRIDSVIFTAPVLYILYTYLPILI